MIELISQALFSGVLAGGYYALVALGLALVFGTTKVINLAHGEMVLLGAYVAFTAESKLGLNPVLAIPLAVAATIIVSLIVARLIGRIVKDRELNSLILTFGIGIVLTNLILMIWTADIRSTSLPWFNDGVLLANTVFTTQGQILAFVLGIGLAAGLWWWLAYSWNGRALRAIASNRNAAMLMAVNPKRVETLSFIVAGLMAGVAGVAIYTVTVIQPPLGTSLTIKAFIITVLAGMGSIPGVIAGALLIGIAEGLTATLANSALQELVGMVLFLIVLLVRPSGLFGARGRVG